MSLLANEFKVQSVLHGLVSLTADNQIYVFHEAMNSCKNLDSLKACFENVNIVVCLHCINFRGVFYIINMNS